jgi:hypothetical protein
MIGIGFWQIVNGMFFWPSWGVFLVLAILLAVGQALMRIKIEEL